MAGLLGSFFNFVDPILDTIDPMHNKVQTWTTGSSTTEGQSPYFQAIAPVILDAFLPGVGSAVGGLDGASTGNWGKAALGAIGAAGQLGSLGSAAADGANGGMAATEATSGLSSTGGTAAGTVESAGTVAAPSTFDASNFAATNNFGQTPVNELGYQGMSSMSGAPESVQFMTMPASEYAAVGGAGQSLGTTTAESARLANAGLLANSAGKGANWGNLATNAGKLYIQQAASAEQQARERAMMQQMQARAAAGQSVDMGGNQGRPAQSFQTLSPYAKFNGGFQGRQYGANVRNRGLLG